MTYSRPTTFRGRAGAFRCAARTAALLGALLATLILAPALSAFAQEDVAVDPQVFPDTGFRVDDAVWPSYGASGGADTFGAPISRAFTLRGATVQLFQRALLQVQPDGSAQPVSLASADWLPYSRVAGLTLPAADPVLMAVTPRPDQPNYPARLREFTRSVVPDVWQNQTLGFQSTLLSTPGALEIWGAPTSAPAADPANPSFVYQRFERGVLMYNGQTGSSSWLPLGDQVKALITGQTLPADLAVEAAGSPLLRQLDPTRPSGVARPEVLPNTSLTTAFVPDAAA